MALTLAELERPLDINDFLESPDDSQRFEIINGEMIVTPSPVPQHGEVVAALFREFDLVVRKSKLGKVYFAPIGVRFADNDILEPDLFFISAERKSIVNPKFIDGIPDLVAEVLSPSTWRIDLVQKMSIYQRAGVREYWVVDIFTRDIRVFVLRGTKLVEQSTDDGFATSQVIPGVSINISELFSNLW